MSASTPNKIRKPVKDPGSSAKREVGPSIEQLLEGSISEEEEQIRTQRNSMRRERGVRRERLVRERLKGTKRKIEDRRSGMLQEGDAMLDIRKHCHRQENTNPCCSELYEVGVVMSS